MREKYVIFGAGKAGADVVSGLLKRGIKPAYFVDNNKDSCDGIHIRLPEVLKEEIPEHLRIIVSPGYPHNESIIKQLCDMGLEGCIVPAKVRIDASTLCNLKCKSCQYHTPGPDIILGKGYLKHGDFAQFVETHPYVSSVELANKGEIFLNPELPNIIRCAYDHGVTLTANSGTNFNYVSDEALEALVVYQFSSLTIAFDCSSPQTYSKYRHNGDFEYVIENVRRLNRMKAKHQSAKPELIYQFILMEHNEHEVSAAKAFAQELDMKISFKLTWEAGYTPANPERLKQETGLSELSREAFFERHRYPYTAYICTQMWQMPAINYDGRIFGCCINTRHAYEGNAFTDGLERVLHTPSYLNAKKTQTGLPCSKCSLAPHNWHWEKWRANDEN